MANNFFGLHGVIRFERMITVSIQLIIDYLKHELPTLIIYIGYKCFVNEVILIIKLENFKTIMTSISLAAPSLNTCCISEVAILLDESLKLANRLLV